jgi:hypothetical protein
MAPATKAKVPSFLADLAQLTGNLKSVPYHQKAQAILDAGYITLLAQTDVTPTATGAVMVTFDLMVGKAYDALERLDSITVTMPPNPGPVSVAARISARDSVIFMLTGELPPRPEPVPSPAPGQMNGGDEHTIDMTGVEDDLPLDDTYVDEKEKPAVKVIDRREPDGLPIFRDLYEIGPGEADSTGEIVEAVLHEVETFLDSASVEQVDALASKNPEMLTFIKDLGTPADSAELRTLVTARKAALAAAPVPKRRVSALQRAN